MLERASHTAEYTAHLFLRQIERPIRSTRYLGRDFWRHEGQELDVPIWWTAYLNSIRSPAYTYSSYDHRSRSDLPRKPSRQEHDSRSRSINSSSIQNTRLLHRSTAKQLALPRVKPHEPDVQVGDIDGFAWIQDGLVDAATGIRHRSTEHQRVTRPLSGSDASHEKAIAPSRDAVATKPLSEAWTVGDRTATATIDRPTAEYRAAWNLFVESGQKQALAAYTMHFLSTSRSTEDRKHAISAFSHIPHDQRSKKDYVIFSRLATRQHFYRIAIQAITEAIRAGFGEDAYFEFMGYCVEHMLWNILAEMWQATFDLKHMIHVRRDGVEHSRSPNFTGDYSFHLDRIPDFPDKLVSLARRLEAHDVVLAAKKSSLVELCKRLTYAALDSGTVMASITGEGALALINIQQRLKFNSKLHFLAIGTISRMKIRTQRSRLALAIFRNFRLTYADTKVPTWVLGSLIKICAASGEGIAVYNELLQEFTRSTGSPDAKAFRVIMGACARQGDVKATHQTFDAFRALHKPNVLDVNCLVHVYAVTGKSIQAQAEFDKIRSELGINPDVGNWSTLILAYARSPEPERAFSVFQSMKQAGVKPNAYTYSVLLTMTARKGDLAHTQELFDEASQMVDAMSVYLLGPLVEAHLKNMNVQQAEKLVMQASRSRRIDSRISLWNVLYRHHAFHADLDRIDKLQLSMEQMGVQADGMTCAARMTALVMQGKTELAAKLLRGLHLSGKLEVTAFHYSILVSGFVREGKRDQATVFYHELQERYPSQTGTARLAMLHLNLQRDRANTKMPETEAARDKRHKYPGHYPGVKEILPSQALNFLTDIAMHSGQAESFPGVMYTGSQRARAQSNSETLFLQSLVSFLQNNYSPRLSNTFMTFLQKHKLANNAINNNISQETSMEVQVLELNQAAHSRQWALVDVLWKSILGVATKLARPMLDTRPAIVGPTQRLTNQISASRDESTNSSLPTDVKHFTSMIPSSGKTTFDNDTAPVLPSKRFILSKPASIYIQALDYQSRHDDIMRLREALQNLGFELSSENYNRYVQCLSKSQQPEHRLEAFATFEENMLLNTADWKILRRGKWLPQASRDGVPQDRRRLERLYPQVARPSYYTMVHMAAVLVKAVRRLHTGGDSSELQTLRVRFPRTVRLLQAMPYLRDRAQGILVRGRRVIGDPLRRVRQTRTPKVDGVTGSQSPLYHIPVDKLQVLEAELGQVFPAQSTHRNQRTQKANSPVRPSLADATPRGRILARHIRRAEETTGNWELNGLFPGLDPRFELAEHELRRIDEAIEKKLTRSLRLAEQLFGEVIRSKLYLTTKSRLETDEEQYDRTTSEIASKLDQLETVWEDYTSHSLSRSLYRGESHIGSSGRHSAGKAQNNRRPLQLTQPLPTESQRPEAEPAASNSSTAGFKNEIQRSEKPDEGSSRRNPRIPKHRRLHWLDRVVRKSRHAKVTSWYHWTARYAYPRINTRVLKRRIEPVYVRGPGIPQRHLTYRMRHAFTLNKQRRAEDIRATQQFRKELRSSENWAQT